MQPAARQNIRCQNDIQLSLLQRRLWIKRNAGFKVHLHLRPVLAEILQRRRQPLNTAVALNCNAQPGLVRLIAGLQGTANLWQHLFRQLQQDLPLRRKAKWLTFTDKQAEAEPLLQIAELVREGRLSLMQGGGSGGQRTAVS